MLPAFVAAWVTLGLIAPNTFDAESARIAPSAVCDARRLPPSITLEPGLEPLVRWALAYSPTFRQQCRVLASMPRFRANVKMSMRRPGAPERARAVVRRLSGGVVAADIEIGSPYEVTELIAHEFEHLIEQLDGVDLTSMARRGEAHQLSSGSFETKRAIAAGRQVAGEIADNAPDRVRTAGTSIWRGLRGAVGR